jgi:hypothetical protein
METQLHVTTNSVLLFPNTAGTWDTITESKKGKISAHNACSNAASELAEVVGYSNILCPRFAIVKYKKAERQPLRFLALVTSIFIRAVIILCSSHDSAALRQSECSGATPCH